MRKLSQKQWIAVVVALVVVLLFYFTGENLVSYFSNSVSNPNENSQNQVMNSASDNSFSSSVTGFEKTDLVAGTGAEAVSGKLVTVNYSGAFTDGKVFDSSYSRGVPFQFMLGAGQVIPGWDMGVEGMKVGGKRRLVIPGELAYGPSGIPGAIPPNATLVFEVELLKVE